MLSMAHRTFRGIRGWWIPLLVLAAAVAGGCDEEQCSRNSDCEPCQSCVRGSCTPIPGCGGDGGADADGDDTPGADADGDGDDGGELPPCGDLVCDEAGGETCALCPADCGECPTPCPDGVCDEERESCIDCPQDCGECDEPVCGDGVCESDHPELPETCGNCAADCASLCGGCGDGECVAPEDPCSCSVDCGTCPAVCGDGFHHPDEECDDGNLTDGDGCDADCTFTCHDATLATDCPDDGNVCTAPPECDPATHGCHYPAEGTDGIICDPGNPCTGVGSCHSGSCRYSSPTDCDDGLPCTTDSCDVASGDCVHVSMAEGSACDDGMFCLVNDRCAAWGGCVGAPDPSHCDDGDTCTNDTCNEALDRCEHTPAVGYSLVDCGTSFSGNTLFGRNEHTTIVCPDGSHATPGNDEVFQVDVGGPGTLAITGTSGGQHAYIVSDPCDDTSCLAHGATVASLTVTAAGTYYVIVDTASPGYWAVEVSCP